MHFHNIVYDAVVDAVHPADATPVARANFVDRWIGVGARYQFIETFEECLEVSIRLHLAVLANAMPVDSLEVCFGGFANPHFSKEVGASVL